MHSGLARLDCVMHTVTDNLTKFFFHSSLSNVVEVMEGPVPTAPPCMVLESMLFEDDEEKHEKSQLTTMLVVQTKKIRKLKKNI